MRCEPGGAEPIEEITRRETSLNRETTTTNKWRNGKKSLEWSDKGPAGRHALTRRRVNGAGKSRDQSRHVVATPLDTRYRVLFYRVFRARKGLYLVWLRFKAFGFDFAHVDWVLPGLEGGSNKETNQSGCFEILHTCYRVFTGFLPSFSRQKRALPSFTGFQGVRFRFRRWERRLPSFTGFWRNPTERNQVLPGFYLVFRVMYKSSPSIYWVLLGFT